MLLISEKSLSPHHIFGEGTIPAIFKLIDGRTSTTGVVVAIYERAENVKFGSFALETPTRAELARRERLKDGR